MRNCKNKKSSNPCATRFSTRGGGTLSRKQLSSCAAKFGFTLAEGATHVAQPKNVGKAAFTKPSRGTSDSERRTIINGNRVFRFDCERCRLTRGAAFTLAEVLITLGIIGVVAAMTIPSLIEKHQKQVTITGLKKIYSELSNIIRLSESENGEMSQWTFPQYVTSSNENESVEFLNKYYVPYTNSAKVYTATEMRKMGYYFYNLGGSYKFTHQPSMILANGSIVSIFSNTERGYIWLLADINGFKKPNKVGRDVFVFDAYHYGDKGTSNYRLRFWGAGSNRDKLSENQDIPEEEKENNRGYYQCNKENKSGYYSGWYCGAMIEKDGWEIKDDYPW